MWTFGLRDLPNNTTKTSGLCTQRPRISGNGFDQDIAYRIDSKYIAISTQELFPRKFPTEYVIMATFRAERDNAGSLFSILTPDRQLSLAFSLNPVGLKYLKPDGNIGTNINSHHAWTPILWTARYYGHVYCPRSKEMMGNNSRYSGHSLLSTLTMLEPRYYGQPVIMDTYIVPARKKWWEITPVTADTRYYQLSPCLNPDITAWKSRLKPPQSALSCHGDDAFVS